jgi:hypothetical protein
MGLGKGSSRGRSNVLGTAIRFPEEVALGASDSWETVRSY